MSANDKSIKVVKRRQRDYLVAQQETPECELKTDRQTSRDIFNTITSWIEEKRETKKEIHRRDCLLLRDASADTV
jgi:hypothetical protein